VNATDLKLALGDLADQALSYSDADRALAAARGRRKRRVVTPIVAAGVAVVLVGAGLLVRSGPATVVPLPVAAGDLPAEVLAPATRPPSLPVDRGVGPGVAVYTTCESCGVDVQLADGRRYAVSGRGAKQDAALSPDGRWLATSGPGRFTLRDLSSTLERQLGADNTLVAWSPDSRWALVEDSGAQHRIDLLTGEKKAAVTGLPGRWRAVALLGGGDVLLARFQGQGKASSDSDREELFIVDPDTGARRSVHVDARRVLRSDEDLSDAHQWVGRLTVSVSGEIAYPMAVSDPDQDTAVIILSSGFGPARRLQPSELSGSAWGPVTFAGSDLLVDHQVDQRHEVLRVDSVTGERRSTTRIGTGISSYAVAGMAEMVLLT